MKATERNLSAGDGISFPIAIPVLPGQIVAGKYRVEQVLGIGGMGVVVAAVHVQLEERVAIKILRADMMAKPDLVARFAREARSTVKIKSEYGVRVLDVGALEDSTPYIVMEYLEGDDLNNVLRDKGPLPVGEAVEYTIQVCAALAEAHAHHIVHRDIKPENLFLVRRHDGRRSIKVLDFGISKAVLTPDLLHTPDTSLTQTLSLMGSPVYMSPEQIRGFRQVDHRSDIWSLGIVLYELLTNSSAFYADSITQLSAIILENPTPSARQMRPELPAELDTIIQRCLEKDPDKRYQNVAELAIALLPFGPKRARVPAEQASCSLQAVGLSRDELRLPPSHPPPANHKVTTTTWAEEGLNLRRSMLPTSLPRSVRVGAIVSVPVALLLIGMQFQHSSSEPPRQPAFSPAHAASANALTAPGVGSGSSTTVSADTTPPSLSAPTPSAHAQPSPDKGSLEKGAGILSSESKSSTKGTLPSRPKGGAQFSAKLKAAAETPDLGY